MASDLLLLFLGFIVGCFITYKLMSEMKSNSDSTKRSILPQRGFLRPKSWDSPKEKEENIIYKPEVYDVKPPKKKVYSEEHGKDTPPF